MIDWHKGTWTEGAETRFHGGGRGTYRVYPGLFWYHGLGSGTFFRADGTMLKNCSPQEAAAEATTLGLKFQYVDSFSSWAPTPVDDR